MFLSYLEVWFQLFGSGYLEKKEWIWFLAIWSLTNTVAAIWR